MAEENDLPEEAEHIDVPEADVEQQEEEATELSEVEQLASDMGWRPKTEWKGDEADFVEAKDFLKNTRDINRNLSRELKDVRKQLDGIGKATTAMTKRAIENERERLEKIYDQAFEEGDKDTAKKAEAELRKLDKEIPSQPATDPEGEAFAQKHASWFNKDAEATQYAVNRAQHYADQGLSPARQIAAVEKDMRKHFPDLIEDAKEQPKPQPSLARPQRQVATQPREKGYATLPPAAKKACDEWVRNMKEDGHDWATKDAWASNFYEQEAANG